MTLPAGAQIGIRAWDVDETVRRDASLESSCTLNDCVQNTAIATPYQIVGNNSDESCLSAYGQAIRTAIDPQGLLVTTTCVSLKSSKTAKHVERRCTLMFTDKAWTPARSLPASPRLVTSSTPCRRCQASPARIPEARVQHHIQQAYHLRALSAPRHRKCICVDGAARRFGSSSAPDLSSHPSARPAAPKPPI